MWKLYENFHILNFQKRIVSAETISGNTEEAWSYINSLSKLDAPISNQQFFGLKFRFE
jgi:hypothetical protein